MKFYVEAMDGRWAVAAEEYLWYFGTFIFLAEFFHLILLILPQEVQKPSITLFV